MDYKTIKKFLNLCDVGAPAYKFKSIGIRPQQLPNYISKINEFRKVVANRGNIIIIIFGGPRTGTSLCCALVQRCGFNFGKTHDKQEERGGYLEHYVSSTPFVEKTNQNKLFLIRSENINAFKIISFHEHIDWLTKEGFVVKIIATLRDKQSRNASTDILTGVWQKKDKVKIQEEIIAQRDKWLENHPTVSVLFVEFEKLIQLDKKTLQAIIDFTDGDCSVDDLKAIINPSQVKYK